MPLRKLYIPPTMMVYCALAMAALFLLFPEYNLIPFPFNLAGLAISFYGFTIMGKTRDLFRRFNTTSRIGKSNHLITEGVFKRTRNPMYLGMFVLVFGLAVFSTNLASLVLPFIFLLLVRVLFIRTEERLLAETFGQDYENYRRQVRRWI